MADFDSLIDLITTTIEPESWDDVGGPGAIESFPGGVFVDGSGVLRKLELRPSDALAKLRDESKSVKATDIRSESVLRKVSLTRLEKELQILAATGRDPSEAMKNLAGIHKIKYVFVYPESGDVVIAGPAGDWRKNSEHRNVHSASGAPVLQLDDLVVMLRVHSRDDPTFGCSITPTKEGMSKLKALAEDPWVATVRTLHPGDAMPGTVVRLERYGAFVEIAPGVDGLVHVSEVSRGRRIHHPKEVLTVGDPVHVQVLRVDPQKRQIALSIQALMDDPWLAAASQYRVGTTIQGHVDSIQSFGVFVELSSGISGLIPMSHLEDDEQRNVHNRFRPGTEVEARVIAVEPERHRLTLSRRKDTDAEARAAYDEYQSQSTASDDGRGFGTFADLLKKKG